MKAKTINSKELRLLMTLALIFTLCLGMGASAYAMFDFDFNFDFNFDFSFDIPDIGSIDIPDLSGLTIPDFSNLDSGSTGQGDLYWSQYDQSYLNSSQTEIVEQAEIARRAGTKAASQKKCVSGLACYSSQYALTERLVCGECGTLYRRCTWSRNGKKRIVWRCISRLEYGTKYCKDSPTIDESPLQWLYLPQLIP